MNLRLIAKATIVAALCGVTAFAGCSSFDEENTGSAQQPICAVGAPCTAGQSCNNAVDGNLTCIGGFMTPNPDVCGAGNACTVQDSWCCTSPTGDSYTCDVGTYGLISLADPRCTCALDADGDGFPACTDCDDADPAVNPGATEVCNGIDDDCDGLIDEGVLLTFCADSDADTYGNPLITEQACSPSVGYVVDCTDCDDTVASINPGAPEVCDGGVDDNCNGLVETTSICGVGEIFCPADPCSPNLACLNPDEVCYDNDSSACSLPAWLRCCGGVLIVDAGACALVDADLDGYTADVDCNDSNPAINPGAVEVCNGVDDNCDTFIDEGNPGGGGACSTGLLGVCAAGTDTCQGGGIVCVQNVAASAEICDGLDNDCDDSTDEGNPGGGAACVTGELGVCSAGTDTCVAGAIACVRNVAPSAETCNGLDDNCNGVVDDNCSNAVRFVWTPPVGYVQTTANVFAIGDDWGVNVPGGYQSFWRNAAGVPAFCTMVLNGAAYECTVNLPGGGTSVCTNAFHEDAACGGSSYLISNGGYMFDQGDHTCSQCLGLGNGCGVAEFGSWDVYVNGVLQAMTSVANGSPFAYNECLANPIP